MLHKTTDFFFPQDLLVSTLPDTRTQISAYTFMHWSNTYKRNSIPMMVYTHPLLLIFREKSVCPLATFPKEKSTGGSRFWI